MISHHGVCHVQIKSDEMYWALTRDEVAEIVSLLETLHEFSYIHRTCPENTIHL